MNEFRVWSTLALLGLLAGGFAATAARATFILSPVTVLGTDMGESSPDAVVEKMIDQSGLDKPFVSGVTEFDTYFTTGDPPFAQAAAGNNWQSETQFTLPVSGVVDFDFGAVYSMDRLAIWNISMRDITIHTSATSIDSVQEVGAFALPNHLNFPFSYSHDLLALGAVHDVRFMRIEIDSVHLFSPTDTFGFAIVGEVVASAVPAAAELDGDYNGNGTVDAADYVVWRETLDQVGSGLAADGDGDGAVDADDYGVWKTHFGETLASGSVLAIESAMAVPEMMTATLCAAALVGRLSVRSGRRGRDASSKRAASSLQLHLSGVIPGRYQ